MLPGFSKKQHMQKLSQGVRLAPGLDAVAFGVLDLGFRAVGFSILRV